MYGINHLWHSCKTKIIPITIHVANIWPDVFLIRQLISIEVRETNLASFSRKTVINSLFEHQGKRVLFISSQIRYCAKCQYSIPIAVNNKLQKRSTRNATRSCIHT